MAKIVIYKGKSCSNITIAEYKAKYNISNIDLKKQILENNFQDNWFAGDILFNGLYRENIYV